MSGGRGRGVPLLPIPGSSKNGQLQRNLDRELEMLRRKRDLLQQEQEILSMECNLEREMQYEQTNFNVPVMYGNYWDPPPPKRAHVPQLTQLWREGPRKTSKQKPKPFSSQMPKPKPPQMPKSMPLQMPKPLPSQMPKPMPSQKPQPMPSQMPKPMPSQKPQPMPSQKPQPMPSQKPQPMPSQMPKPMPSQNPHPMPSEMPKPMPSEMTKPMASQMPKPMPSQKPQSMPSEMPKPMPSQKPQPMPSEMPKPMPSSMTKPMPSQMPKPMSSQMPKPMPSQMPKPMPSQMAKPMPTQMPKPMPPEMTKSMPSEITKPMPSQTPEPTSSQMPKPTPSQMPQPMPSNCIQSLMEIKINMPQQPNSNQETVKNEIVDEEYEYEMGNSEQTKMESFHVDDEEESEPDSEDYTILGEYVEAPAALNIEEQNVFNRPQVRHLLRNISNAARKRFRILIRDKIPWEQAMVMCQKKWSQMPNYIRPRKRAYLKKLNVMLANEMSPPEPNYFTKTDRCMEVHIQNYERMTEEQATALRHCLIVRILKAPKGEGPRFDDYGFRAGVLSVSCRDKQSQTWLVSNVPQLEPWPGARLGASIVHVPPKSNALKVLIPLSETTDVARAFTMFKVQNRGLNTEEWKLIASQPTDEGTYIAVSVDQRSVIALKESEYRACLGFKTVCFSMLHRKPGVPKKPFVYNKYKPKKKKKRF